MLLKRNAWGLVGAIAVLVLAPAARGQFGQFYDSLPSGAYEHGSADQILTEPYFHPFIEPCYFNHDLQFFAPADDIDTYGGPVLRTGWFGSYSRMYLRVSRPDDEDSFDQMDRTWGNRWDIGYMIDDVDHDHGWLFSYMHVSGPNTWNTHMGVGIPDVPDQQQQQGNQQQQQEEVVVLQPDEIRGATDSVNVGDLSSFEINKLFRMAPLNHGGILEPFFGFRYVKFVNVFQRETMVLYDDTGVIYDFPPIPPAGGLVLDDVTIQDILFNPRYTTTNHMVGGQLGLRWMKRVNRWNLSSEVRAFAFQNFQQMTRTVGARRTYYDVAQQGGQQGNQTGYGAWNPQQTQKAFTSTTQNSHTTETVLGTDIRAEAAFELTRDVSLTAGMQFLGFFTGIGRGPLSDNSQDLVLVGFTFGVLVNR